MNTDKCKTGVPRLDEVLAGGLPDVQREAIAAEFSIPLGALLKAAFDKAILNQVVTGEITDPAWRAITVSEISKLIAPEEILFIDDRLENIEMAKFLGMQGHRYQGFTGLKALLNA